MGKLFWRTIRGRFLTVSAVSLAVTTAFLRRQGVIFFSTATAVVFLGGLLVHIGGNLWNDYADEENGTDRINQETSPFNGGSRVIQEGLLGAGEVRRAALTCFAAALGLALLLVPTRGMAVPALTLLGIGLAIAYSSPPFWLVGRGLGELTVGVAFGPLLCEGTAVALTGRFSREVLALAVPLGFMVAAVLTINAIPDRPADDAVGKRTLAVRLHPRGAVLFYRLLLAGTFVSLFFLVDWARWPSLLALPWGIRLIRDADRVGPVADAAFKKTAAGTVGLHLFLGLLLFLATFF